MEAADEPVSPLKVAPDAPGPGLRDWFGWLGRYPVKATAFDTRMHGLRRADRPGIQGGDPFAPRARFRRDRAAESFLVTKQDRLEPQETARAREWGTKLAGGIAPSTWLLLVLSRHGR